MRGPGSLNRRFDAAMVDLDGTLVDTVGDFACAVNAMLADLHSGLRLDAATVGRLVGKGSEHLIKSVLNLALAQQERAPSAIKFIANFDLAHAGYQRHYHAINGQHAALYPGALQGLQAMQQVGLRLACLTNKPVAFARTLLKLKGLDGFFSEVFGGDSFERKKPDPLPLLKTCAALGSLPARTLMVGDSSNDALAARAAGCPVVLVTYGYNHGEPVRALDADGFVDSLADIGAFLQAETTTGPPAPLRNPKASA